MADDVRTQALDFLKTHNAGVIATASLDGQPHASAIYYVADDKFNVYFMTLFNTRKFGFLKGNPKVAFTVGTADTPQTLQIEGTAEELKQEEDVHAHIADLVQALTSNTRYYAPITQLPRSESVIFWVRPTWVRWADYTAGKAGENVLTEIPL